jgi:four helix bundle protein
MNTTYKKHDPAFEKAIELAHLVYDLLPKFPAEERYGICNQLRRAVLSVPANMTEGYARRKGKVFLNHLEIAYGSLMEVKFFLHFSCKRAFITTGEYVQCWNVLDQLGALLWKSIITLESTINEAPARC